MKDKRDKWLEEIQPEMEEPIEDKALEKLAEEKAKEIYTMEATGNYDYMVNLQIAYRHGAVDILEAIAGYKANQSDAVEFEAKESNAPVAYEINAIYFAEWLEINGYRIKGMDDTQKRNLYQIFKNKP